MVFGGLLKVSTKLRKRKQKRRSRLDNAHRLVEQEGGTKSGFFRRASYVMSEAVADVVIVFEAVVWLLFIMMLILAVVLMTIVSTLFAGVFGWLGGTVMAVGQKSGGALGVKGSSGVMNYSEYDWYGNMQNNLLRLDTVDKEIYQLITCSMELEKYAVQHGDGRSWNGAVGVGILYGEMSGGLSTVVRSYHEGTEEEKSILINDKLNYPFAYNCLGYTTDGLGDGPIGLSWGLADADADYTFGHWDLSTVKKLEWLKDSRVKSGHSGYTDMQSYAFWTIPGSLKWCLYNNSSINFDSNVSGNSLYKCSEQFDRWGIEKTQKNLMLFQGISYYAKHHGCGSADREYVTEYALALYKFADSNLSNVYLVDGNGKPTKPDNAHSVYREFLSDVYADGSSSCDICVIHDGKAHIYDYESGDTLAKALLAWAKTNNEAGYNTLKQSIDWGCVGAPHFYSGSGVPNATFNSNLCNCLGIWLVGQSVVKYIADSCGIVLGSGDGVLVSASTPGGTQTAKNVVAMAEDLYQKHGINSSDVWTWGYNELLYADGTEAKNFSDNWCAMFVNTVLNKAKVGGTGISVATALREVTGNAFPATAVADLGYCPGSSSTQNIYYWRTDNGVSKESTASSVTKSGYVIAHYGGTWSKGTDLRVRDANGEYALEGEYKPKAGDIITYCNGGSAYCHVGLIVTDGDGWNSGVTTIEGNTGSGSVISRYETHSSASVIFEINYSALEKHYGGTVKSSSTSARSMVYCSDAVVDDRFSRVYAKGMLV